MNWTQLFVARIDNERCFCYARSAVIEESSSVSNGLKLDRSVYTPEVYSYTERGEDDSTGREGPRLN